MIEELEYLSFSKFVDRYYENDLSLTLSYHKGMYFYYVNPTFQKRNQERKHFENLNQNILMAELTHTQWWLVVVFECLQQPEFK